MKRLLQKTLIALTLILSTNSNAQDWDEIAKSLPIPAMQNLDDQYYGGSVSADGNYAVIGVYGYNGNTGTAFVLFYDGSNWLTQAQLSASDGAYGDKFGGSVSISGDNIVVGASGDYDNGFNSGSAYLFHKPCNLPDCDIGIEEAFKTSLSIYPNPAKETLIIELNQLFISGYIITDQLGKVVKEGNITSQKQDIDVSTLSKGVYAIRVGEVNQKFIKE